MHTTQKKVILLTGASSGIGQASAERLVREGHTVYGTARTEEEKGQVAKTGAVPLVVEMTEHETLERAVATVIEKEGRIDVLYNNAGFACYGAIENVTIDEARKQFEVNLFGLARLVQLVLPHMRAAGAGRIINTSSMGGKIYMPLGAWYHASKHAIEGWSDCLRLEVAQFSLDVVILEPGAIRTNLYDVFMNSLVARSVGTPYETITRRFARTIEPHTYSDPSLIAELACKAVRAKKPRIRYVAGKYAHMLLFVRRYLGDNLFDRIIMSMLK
jgi:NAD(P)-dependent dehydrogenase (short-subunit alcohol dehydrogenase family)